MKNESAIALVNCYKHFKLPTAESGREITLYSYYVKTHIILGRNRGKHTIGCVVIGRDPHTNHWCRGISIVGCQEQVVGKGYGKYEAYCRWRKAATAREALVPKPLPNSASGVRFKNAMKYYGNDFKEQFMSAYAAELNEFEQKIVSRTTSRGD